MIKFSICLIVGLFVMIVKTFSQDIFNQLGVSVYKSFDHYPEIKNPFDPITSSFIKMKGQGWGFDLMMNFPLNEEFKVCAGIGYYKYAFDHIDQKNDLFGKGNARLVNYVGPLSINYSTQQYWYDCITIHLGTKKRMKINENTFAMMEVGVENYLTYRQVYKLNAEKFEFKQKSFRFFGCAVDLKASLIKNIGNNSIGPFISLSLLDAWKKDDFFPGEKNSSIRAKIVGGVSLGINFFLNKSTKKLTK